MIIVHNRVHPMTLFQDSAYDSNLVWGDVQTKGGRISTRRIKMTIEAISGVHIVFENSSVIGAVPCTAGSFKIGPHVSHLDACILL